MTVTNLEKIFYYFLFIPNLIIYEIKFQWFWLTVKKKRMWYENGKWQSEEY